MERRDRLVRRGGRGWRELCYTARPITKNISEDFRPMGLRRFCFGFVAAAMLCIVLWAQAPAGTSGASSAKRVLTVDDYFRLKEVDDPQVSPDAKWVAYTVKTANLSEDKNDERVWMVPAAGGSAIPLTA